MALAATSWVSVVSRRNSIPPSIVVSILRYGNRDTVEHLNFHNLNSFAPKEAVARSLNSFLNSSIGSPIRSSLVDFISRIYEIPSADSG